MGETHRHDNFCSGASYLQFCSVAILIYLVNKSDDIPDHWYPKDARKRARVDQYMAWQHRTIRQQGISVFLEMVLIPIFSSSFFNFQISCVILSEHISLFLSFLQGGQILHILYIQDPFCRIRQKLSSS